MKNLKNMSKEKANQHHEKGLTVEKRTLNGKFLPYTLMKLLRINSLCANCVLDQIPDTTHIVTNNFIFSHFFSNHIRDGFQIPNVKLC